MHKKDCVLNKVQNIGRDIQTAWTDLCSPATRALPLRFPLSFLSLPAAHLRICSSLLSFSSVCLLPLRPCVLCRPAGVGDNAGRRSLGLWCDVSFLLWRTALRSPRQS